MADWKKEIKLSDLFGRSGRKARPEAELDGPDEPNPEKRAGSFLKRDLSFSRKSKQPKAPKEPKADRKARGTKEPRGRAAKKGSTALPQIPLMRAFNLLPKDDPRESAERRASPAKLALAVVAVVALAGLGAYFLLLNTRVAGKTATRDELKTKLAVANVPAERPLQEEEVDPALIEEKLKRTGALSSALGGRTAWDRLLREFSLVLPDDISLTKLTASAAVVDPAAPVAAGTPAPTSTFTIEGYTETQKSVAQLLARLAVLPELSSVQLKSSMDADFQGQIVVQFVIAANVKPVTGATA
jgi:Tfp pilus assembly protein PilN